jgi:hypothetical protein
MSVIEGSVGTESGRRVAYAQMGRLDGTPLLYFHGGSGSRLDFAQPLGVAALEESGVRLIGSIARALAALRTRPVGDTAIGLTMSARLPMSLVSTGLASLDTPPAVRMRLPVPWRFPRG